MPDVHALPRWLGLSLVVVLADQLTKWLAVSSLTLGVDVPLLPGLGWRLAYNTGAAFSMLSDGAGWQRWLLAGLAVFAAVAIIVWLARLPRHDWLQGSALALILGGALGNLVDRLRLGYVVDFVDVYYRQWHWPAFNVADSAITVGAALILLAAWRQGRHPSGGS